MGKCTEALKAKLRSLDTFKDTDENSDAIKIIKSIKSVAFKLEAHEKIHVATFMLKIRIVNLRQQDMSLINYLKKFQANKLVNKQIQGGLWEDTIITLAALKKIRAYTTIDTFKFESCRLF